MWQCSAVQVTVSGMRARKWCVLLYWASWAWCSSVAGAALLPACPPDAGARCLPRGYGFDEHTFTVDYKYLKIDFREGAYFAMSGNLSLDNPALPRFNSTLRVARVVLAGFPVPRRAYRAVLAALGVEPSERLELRAAAGQLERHHLAGLDDCRALALDRVRLAPDAFDAAPRLERLRLDAARPALLARLPASLRELQLVDVGLELLDRAALSRFPNLTALIVRDDAVDVRVEPVAPLAELAVQARAAHVDLALPATLARLTLHGWGAEEPEPWSACAALDTLKVQGGRARSLPADWLRRCGALRELYVRAAPLADTHPAALAGARSLRRATLAGSALRRLPVHLLSDARDLTYLDLSENRLELLQGSLFASLRNLTVLNLTHNNLTNETFDSLSGVESLRVLRLDHNPRLGDACDGGLNGIRGASKLEFLKNLSELYLRNTSARYVCRDWRAMRLARLDLRANRIEELTYGDLQFAADTRVELAGNDVRRLLYTRADYEALVGERAAYCERGPDGAAPPLAWRARVQLDATLECDCGAGWAAAALRACPAHVRAEPRCRGSGAKLASLPPDALACAVRGCPAPCACGERVSPAARPPRVMRVTCAAANLTAPPPLGAGSDWAWELRLAHNNISSLRVDELPPNLLELDLRHNNVSDAAILTSMLKPGRRVLFAGNPLRCDCSAAAALADLVANQAMVADYAELACDDGAAPRPPADCGAGTRGALLPLLALPPLLALAVLVACALRPDWRERIKALLLGAGLLPRPREADERPFDVFLSFSHGDEQTALALQARLERAAYRVCVHYRDWAPGGWIPAQIAASVRRSRRTLALVSAHFLASRWALAEWREAYGAALRDGAPRLLVVLLDEPARLPLGADLRRYLAANTYLRWGDPWFWQKLQAALPPPRGPAPPPAPEPGPPPPAPEPGPPSAEPLTLQLSVDALPAELRAPA